MCNIQKYSRRGAVPNVDIFLTVFKDDFGKNVKIYQEHIDKWPKKLRHIKLTTGMNRHDVLSQRSDIEIVE